MNSSTFKLTIILCGSIILSCAPGPEEIFAAIDSPRKDYTLTVTVAEPAMPHGKFEISIYLTDLGTGTKLRLISEPLENDGVPFTAKNIGVRWLGDSSALICLRASSLPPKGVWVRVIPQPFAELKPHC